MKIDIRHRMIGTIPLLEVVRQTALHQPLPIIVYYHGWQTQKELVLTQGRKLAKAGFRVLLPDALNHGERKAPVSPIPSLTFWQSIHTNLFEFSLVIDFFKELGLVDWIGVGGVSMGGMTTCGLLTHHPEISAAACVMGSPDYLRYREDLMANLQRLGLKLPEDYLDLTSWIGPYDLATNYEKLEKRPLFFWHGEADEKIPFAHIADFTKKYANPAITFQATKDKHLVKGDTMDQVTAFFVEAFQESQG